MGGMDESGFEAFYRESRDGCFRAVIVAVADSIEAEDLLAEAYVRCLESWPTIRTHPAPEAWVITVAMNLHRDRWRKASRAVRSLFTSEAAETPSLPIEPNLLAAIQSLPEQQRRVLAFRIILDFDTSQTADALGIAPGTVTTPSPPGLDRASRSVEQREGELMNDLIEFEDVIADLRDGLNDVHFDREPPTRRSTVRRMAWVPAVAAGLVVMFLAISPGISDGIAWAAVARPTTPDEQAWITEDCAESLATTPGDWPDTLPLLMTSEVRGNTATLNFAGDGWFVTCVVAELSRNDGYEPGLSVVSMGYDHELTEGDGALRFNILGLAPDPIDGPEGVEATTFVTGVVSEEVVRVVIDVPDLGEVEATVANGWFTAWWPSRQPFVVRGLASDNNPIVEVPTS